MLAKTKQLTKSTQFKREGLNFNLCTQSLANVMTVLQILTICTTRRPFGVRKSFPIYRAGGTLVLGGLFTVGNGGLGLYIMGCSAPHTFTCKGAYTLLQMFRQFCLFMM